MTYSSIIEGFQILAQYSKEKLEARDIAAEHDEIFAGPNDPYVVSEVDQRRLLDLGWRISDSGWSHLV